MLTQQRHSLQKLQAHLLLLVLVHSSQKGLQQAPIFQPGDRLTKLDDMKQHNRSVTLLGKLL